MTPELWISLVLGLFGLFGGGAGVAAVIRVNSQKRVDESSADNLAEETRQSIMGMIQEGTKSLKHDLEEARAKIVRLENEVSRLRTELDSDASARRIAALEKDVLFWRARADTLQGTLDKFGYLGRRESDEGPPDHIPERRSPHSPPSDRTSWAREKRKPPEGLVDDP